MTAGVAVAQIVHPSSTVFTSEYLCAVDAGVGRAAQCVGPLRLRPRAASRPPAPGHRVAVVHRDVDGWRGGGELPAIDRDVVVRRLHRVQRGGRIQIPVCSHSAALQRAVQPRAVVHAGLVVLIGELLAEFGATFDREEDTVIATDACQEHRHPPREAEERHVGVHVVTRAADGAELLRTSQASLGSVPWAGRCAVTDPDRLAVYTRPCCE